MSKHTPAPWHSPIWHGDEEMNKRADALGIARVPALTNDGSRFVMADGGRVALVDCKAEYKRGKGHQTECAERDANARLIAAAPELLDALKLALQGLDVAASNSPDTDEHAFIGYVLAADKARAAIAKAEGK